MQPRLVIIIPMYGKEEYTNKCIEMVNQNCGIREPIEILVVDDGSEKPYVNSSVNVIRLDTNSGFTAAANEGILLAQYRNREYVLLLNNDTEGQPNFAQSMLDVMDSDQSIGITCSVRLHPTKDGDQVELCGSDLIRGYQYFTSEEKLPTSPLDINWAPLCSGILRMDMIREIGLLDKRFRNHCSDSSYCLWAKINNWKVLLVPTSKVIHHMSVTTSANKINVEADQKKLLEKLAGLDYARIMAEMPLDGEAKTWGKLDFTVYEK